MRPRFTSDDLTDDAMRHAEHAPKARHRETARQIQSSDCDNIDVAQFSIAVFVSELTRRASLAGAVMAVVTVRGLEQVRGIAAERRIAPMQDAQRRIEVLIRELIGQS